MRKRTNQSSAQSVQDTSSRVDPDQINNSQYFQKDDKRNNQNDLDDLVSDLLQENQKFISQNSNQHNLNDNNIEEQKSLQPTKNQSRSPMKDQKRKLNQDKTQRNKEVTSKPAMMSARIKNGDGIEKYKSPQREIQSSHSKSNVMSDQSENVQVSAKAKSVKQILEQFQLTVRYLESQEQMKQDYQNSLTLQKELQKYINVHDIPQILQNQVQKFLKEHQVEQNELLKVKSQSSSNSQNHNSAPRQRRLGSPLKSNKNVQDSKPISPQSGQQKIPNIFYNSDLSKKEQIQQLLQSYENNLQKILAKDIQNLKNLDGKSLEQSLALQLIYFFCSLDQNITLTTDKKQVMDTRWSEIQKYFSNSGKVLSNLKKLREQIELNKIENSHFAQILKISQETCIMGRRTGSVQEKFDRFIEDAITYTKLVKEASGVSQEQLKTPQKRIRTQQSQNPRLTSNHSSNSAQKQMNLNKSRLASPNLRSGSDQKYSIEQDLYSKETESLVKTARDKSLLSQQQKQLLSLQKQINQMKLNIEKEESMTLKQKKQEEELSYLEQLRKEKEKDRQLKEQKQRLEKQEFLQRQKEMIYEMRDVKEFKKKENQRLQEIDTNFLSEQEFRTQQERQQKIQEKDMMREKQEAILAKEKYERELQNKMKEEEYQKREEERKKEIQKQMKELKQQEEALSKEIEMLKQLKVKSIKIPGQH